MPNKEELKELKLYEIREETEDKIDELLTAQAEGDEAKTESLSTELDILMETFDAKAGNVIKYYKNLRRTAKAVREEAKELSAIAKTMENKCDDAAEYLEKQMKLLGRTRIQHGAHSARFQKSPMAVEILDESEIPDEYKKIEVKVNRQAIHKNYKENGEILPGTDMVQGEHLRIQ